MFLLAGHEVRDVHFIIMDSESIFITSTIPPQQTTANTLCFALGLLALHQEAQEDLYQQIGSVLQENLTPVRLHFIVQVQ